ncbi:MAG: tail fiber domain-containing protein [Cloacibacterium sp.]|nr:tail fiber domain-containing protein [Cloacibacterium sp.]
MIPAITGSLMEVDGKIKTTALNLNSDFRLKEKISVLDNTSSMLKLLKPVSYYWNQKGKEKGGDNILQYGFIAQDVEQIAANLVQTDADGYKSVNYIQIIPLLVKSYQESRAELEKEKEKNIQQEQRIKALEEKINALLKK